MWLEAGDGWRPVETGSGRAGSPCRLFRSRLLGGHLLGTHAVDPAPVVLQVGELPRRRGSRRTRPHAGSFDVRTRQGSPQALPRGTGARPETNWSLGAGGPVNTADGKQRPREVNSARRP